MNNNNSSNRPIGYNYMLYHNKNGGFDLFVSNEDAIKVFGKPVYVARYFSLLRRYTRNEIHKILKSFGDNWIVINGRFFFKTKK